MLVWEQYYYNAIYSEYRLHQLMSIILQQVSAMWPPLTAKVSSLLLIHDYLIAYSLSAGMYFSRVNVDFRSTGVTLIEWMNLYPTADLR